MPTWPLDNKPNSPDGFSYANIEDTRNNHFPIGYRIKLCRLQCLFSEHYKKNEEREREKKK